MDSELKIKGKSVKQTDRLYESYLKQYEKYSATAKLSYTMSKAFFVRAYDEERKKTDSNVIRSLVQSQADVTRRQSTTWSKNIKENLKKWRKMDKSDLSEEQRTLLELAGDSKFTSRNVRTEENKAFWGYMHDNLDSWSVILHS